MSEELVAPEASLRAMQVAGIAPHQATALRIAAPIVAAELRKQADRIATHSAGLAQMYAHRLRVRADEVEGLT